MPYSVYIAVLFTLFGTAVSGAVFLRQYRQIPGVRSLTGILFALAAWAVCDALSAVSPNEETALVFESKLRYAAVAMANVFILMLVLEHIGCRERLYSRWFLWLTIAPLIIQGVIWLGPPKAFLEVNYVQRGGFYLPESRQFGPWFVIHASYIYMLLFLSLGLLMRRMVQSEPPYRSQAAILLVGLVLVFVAGTIRTFGSKGLLEYDWIVIASAVTVALWVVALFRFRLFDIVPVARSALIEGMDDSVIVLDLQDRVVDCNLAAQRNLGWTPAAVLGQSLADVLPELSPERFQTSNSLSGSQVEITLESRVFDVRVSLLWHGKGRLVGRLCVLRDITERTSLEKLMRENKEQTQFFQQKLVALHEVTMELEQIDDLLTLYRRVIELGCARLGFERIGLFMIDEKDPALMMGTFGIDPQGQLRDESSTHHAISENNLINEVLKSKARLAVWENATLWDERQPIGSGWNATAALWNGTEVIGWLVIDNLISHEPFSPHLLDLLALYGGTLGPLVTNLRHRTALRESEASFRRLSEATFEGIVIFDQGVIQDANRSFAAMMGYELSELVEMKVMDMVSPEVVTIVAEKMQSAGEETYETVAQRKDGTTFPVEIYSRPFPHYSGKARVAAVRDLTQRKQAERQAVDLAIQRERVRLLATFITKASHEFRTPLSIIETRVYLLRRVTDPDRRQAYLSDISMQVRGLAALIDAMVTMTRLDTTIDLNVMSVDMAALLSALYANHWGMFKEKAVTITLEVQQSPIYVRGHRSMFVDAFSRLLDNAARYTPAGGLVHVEVSCAKEELVVEIRDTGPGMTLEEQKHIFERFFRGDEAHTTRGFGLGLPIARRIIELHGGRIEVESTPKVGSVFRVLLPLDNMRQQQAVVENGA